MAQTMWKVKGLVSVKKKCLRSVRDDSNLRLHAYLEGYEVLATRLTEAKSCPGNCLPMRGEGAEWKQRMQGLGLSKSRFRFLSP